MPHNVKSRPQHQPLRADPNASTHVLVAESPGLQAVLRVLDALKDSDASTFVCWLGDVPEELAGSGDLRACTDMQTLANALRDRLATSGMGTRLYLAGRESFVWEASLPARTADMREDAIQREACDATGRRVFCVHCRHVLEDVRTTPVACPGCGMVLGVRDHFSRVLAAYLGVCADPSAPGRLPEATEPFA